MDQSDWEAERDMRIGALMYELTKEVIAEVRATYSGRAGDD